MKLIMPLIAVGLLAACGEGAMFSGRNGPRVIEKQDTGNDAKGVPTNSTGEPVPIAPEKPAVEPSSFSLTVTSQERKEDVREPVELVFVVDNSNSMADNIAKLRESVSKLFTDLSLAQIKFKARVLTMDRVLGQLVDIPGANIMAPAKIFGTGKPSFDRGAPYDNLYASVEVFQQDRPVADIDKIFANVVDQTSDLYNEPGICLALDYMNWVEFNTTATPTKFAANQKMHIIALSDEDNDATIQDVDKNTNMVKSEKDLACYQTITNAKVCTKEKYNVSAEWTGYGYQWTEPTSVKYRYKFKYASVCQERGYATYPTGSDNLDKLKSTAKCAKQQNSCQDKSQPTNYYSCVAGSYTRPVGTSNYSGVLGRCEVLQNFECEQYVDGQLLWRSKSRADALAILNNAALNLKCRIPESTTPSWVATDLNLSDPTYNNSLRGVRACQAYSCSVSSTTYATVTVDKVVSDGNSSRYTNCGAPTTVASNPYLITKDGAGNLTGLSKKACSTFGTQYSDLTVDPYYISNDAFCATDLDEHSDLSTLGVTREFLAASGPNEQPLKISSLFTSTQTLAQVATAMGLNSAHMSEIVEEPVTSGGQTVSEFYTYDKYPVGSAFRGTKVNFTDLTSGPNVGRRTEILQSAAYNANPPKNGAVGVNLARGSATWIANVKETEVKDANGIFEREVCTGTGEPIVNNYKPTAENFLKLMTDLHPGKAITWHSIVNMDGKSCAGKSETNVTKGSAYLDLSAATRGLTGDICEPDFKKFTTDLTYRVINVPALEYGLADNVKDALIELVLNQTTGTELLKDKDFTISDGKISFKDGVIQIGDQIEIKYLPVVKP